MEHNWSKMVGALRGLQVEQAMHYTCRAPLFGALHDHDRRFHISCVVAGNGRIEADGRTFDVGPGDVVFIRPRVRHQSIDDAKTRYELIEIKFSATERRSEHAIPPIQTVIHVPDMAAFVPALDRLVAAHLVDSGDEGWLARLRLGEVLLLLASEAERPDVPHAIGDDVVHKVRQAERYLALNYSTPVTVNDLAELVCLSPCHFAACFKRVTGVSPIEQLIQTRLRHAQELLLDSTMSIGQVASVCGFRTPQYFCRSFRQRIGCSPRAYRSGAPG